MHGCEIRIYPAFADGQTIPGIGVFKVLGTSVSIRIGQISDDSPAVAVEPVSSPRPRPISFPHVKNCSRNMLNIDENDPRLLEIFNHYGEEHQRFKCAEECMELMAATFRYAQIDFDLSLTEEEKAAERQKQIQSIESEIADVLVVTSEFIAAGKTIGGKKEFQFFKVQAEIPACAAFDDPEEARNVIAGMIEILDNPEESRKRIYSEMDRKIQRQIDRIKGE